jgi:hypothetical protein
MSEKKHIRLEYPISKIYMSLADFITKSEEFKADLIVLSQRSIAVCTSYDEIAKVTLEGVKKKFDVIYELNKNHAVLFTSIKTKEEFLDYIKNHIAQLEKKYKTKIDVKIAESENLIIDIDMSGIGLYVFNLLAKRILQMFNQYARSLEFRGGEIELEGKYGVCVAISKKHTPESDLLDTLAKL